MRSSRSIKSAPTQCPDPLGGGDTILNLEPESQNKHEKITLESVTELQSPVAQESQKLVTSEPEHPRPTDNRDHDRSPIRSITDNINSHETGKASIKGEIITRPNNQTLPQPHDGKIWKYKFDENYLKFIQSFTNYCKDRSNLIFDGSLFFDDDFFPSDMHLVDFVPINVVAPCVKNLELQVPSYNDYCKFTGCGSSLYDYFEDYQAIPNREMILRNQVNFILNSLHCPHIINLSIDSTQPDDINTDQYPADRLSTWNENISYFISRHFKTIQYIQVNAVRYKGLSTSNSFPTASKRSFPKLKELLISLWDDQGPPSANLEENGEDKNVWMPDWLPDLADQYWISLMKSQIHGMLTKLCWISPASLSWDDVFQPILDSNQNSLVCVHIMETEGLMDGRNTKRRSRSNGSGVSFSSSTMVLSCAAFSKLENLKCLSLRKPNSYLTHLEKLPKSLEELSIDKISVKSGEIETLKHLPALKVLRLLYNTESEDNANQGNIKESYGVNKQVIKTLIHIRTLQELCIWGHCLEVDISELESMKSFNVMSVLDRINKYLTNICNSSQKISPTQFYEWNSQQANQDNLLYESLGKLGFVDEDGVVIHEQF